MNQETINLQVKSVNGMSILFPLRMISVAEDGEYGQRRTAIADKKNEVKAEAEYRIYVDALANWSVGMPTIKKAEGEEEPLGDGTPSEAIQEFFKDKTAAKEWMVVSAVGAYRQQLYPTVTFPSLSE